MTARRNLYIFKKVNRPCQYKGIKEIYLIVREGDESVGKGNVGVSQNGSTPKKTMEENGQPDMKRDFAKFANLNKKVTKIVSNYKEKELFIFSSL